MTEDQLSRFRKSIRKFRTAYAPTLSVWQGNIYTTIDTLVQNLGFDADIDNTHIIMKAIKSLASYEEGNHFINYIWDEIDMIHMGITMEGDVDTFTGI